MHSSASPRTTSLADWRPPNAPAWPLHDMRGSRGVGDARAVRPLRALSDACRPDGRDCAPAGLMGVCARIRRRSRSSSRQLRPSGAKRRVITVMTSPPSASKSAMGFSRRVSREPGQWSRGSYLGASPAACRQPPMARARPRPELARYPSSRLGLYGSIVCVCARMHNLLIARHGACTRSLAVPCRLCSRV